MPTKETLAARIARLRNNLDYTVEGFSAASGVKATTLQKIEQGGVLNPRRDTLSKIARALGVSIDYLDSGRESARRA